MSNSNRTQEIMENVIEFPPELREGKIYQTLTLRELDSKNENVIICSQNENAMTSLLIKGPAPANDQNKLVSAAEKPAEIPACVKITTPINIIRDLCRQRMEAAKNSDNSSIKVTPVVYHNEDNVAAQNAALLPQEKISTYAKYPNDTHSTSNEENDTEDEKPSDTITRILTMLGVNTDELFSIKSSEGVRFWICPVNDCVHVYTRILHLKIHILEHYKCKPFKCDVDDCNWAFYSAFKLKRHKEVHGSNNKNFVCGEDGCPKKFTTKHNLRMHKHHHNRPKSQACTVPDCSEVFRTKRELEKHLFKSHGPKYAPYICPVESCRNPYYSYNALISHSRTHQYKPDELKCNWENCGKMFDQPCRLRQHMRQHTGDKPYQCPFENCTKSFVSSSKLRRHERSHIKDRRFPCPYEGCDKSFLRNEHLNQHLEIHHEKHTVICSRPGCGLLFTSKKGMYTHVSNVHSGKNKMKKKRGFAKSKAKVNGNDIIASDETNIINGKDEDEPNMIKPIESLDTTNRSDIDLIANYNQESNIMYLQDNNAEQTVQHVLPENIGIDSENGTRSNTLMTNYESEPQTDPGHVNLTDVMKFYDGVTLENGISVKIGRQIENSENCDTINSELRLMNDFITTENCIVEVTENEISSNEYIQETDDIEETMNEIKKKGESDNGCARTFFTYQQFCEDRSHKSNKSHYENEKGEETREILYDDIISQTKYISETNSIQIADIAYDVNNFEINEQYLTLINQDSPFVYQIQELNDQITDTNRSKVRLRAYSITEDKTSMPCNDSETYHINWGNKSLTDSNDSFNFGIKRDQITASSLMQYEMIESFNEKMSKTSQIHDGIGELLSIDNLDPNFYETDDNSVFIDHDIRNNKDIM